MNRKQRSTLRALKRIHRRHLGPIPSCGDLVIFETSLGYEYDDITGYQQAWRIEASQRWVPHASYARFAVPVVVEGPRWVHTVFERLTDANPHGQELRWLYGDSGHRLRGISDNYTGEAIAPSGIDVVDTALCLWTPEDPESPYQRFAGAYRAAAKL